MTHDVHYLFDKNNSLRQYHVQSVKDNSLPEPYQNILSSIRFGINKRGLGAK